MTELDEHGRLQPPFDGDETAIGGLLKHLAYVEDDWSHRGIAGRHRPWIPVHLTEEYARHNGHADLFHEAVDGATGE